MINKIEKLLLNSSRKSVNSFERILIDRYSNKLKKDNIDFSVINCNNKLQICADEGLLGYTGKTVVEIRLYKLINGMYKFTEQELLENGTKRISDTIHTFHGLKNYIIITNTDVYNTNVTINERIAKLVVNFKPINLEFVDISFLIKEIEEINNILEDFESLDEQIFNLEIRNAVTTEENWKKKRNDLLKKANNRFKSDDVVLFLGAGASIDAGIPPWNKLITNMFINSLKVPLDNSNMVLNEREKSKIIEYFLASNEGAPTLQAMYIKTMGSSQLFDENTLELKSFQKSLYKVLYNECICKSILLKEIVEFCRPVRDGTGPFAVVTYNFDDLVEQNLEISRVRYKPIYKDFVNAEKNELPIYHVHGYLPQNMNGENDSDLVFTQDEYHKLYYDYYHWSNLVQLDFLKSRTCIFVGLSMLDPNLRRMLDLAKEVDADNNTIKKHFAILQRDSLYKKKSKEVNVEHIKAFEKSNQHIKEKYYEGLGVNVIWYDKHIEIPKLLQLIRDYI